MAYPVVKGYGADGTDPSNLVSTWGYGLGTANGFAIAVAAATGPAAVRVYFTRIPRASDPTAIDDALNPALWTLSGPATALVTSCSRSYDSPLAIDVFTSLPLAAGLWRITVNSAVMAIDGSSLLYPRFADFTVNPSTLPTPDGAENEGVIRRHLSSELKGPAWDALIEGLELEGIYPHWDNARNGFDQLFAASASGKYLDRRGGEVSVPRPDRVGMDDSVYRRLILALSKHRVTRESILDLLEVFYGVNSSRACLEATVSEPYALADGDELVLRLQERFDVRVVMRRENFDRIAAASALEVAMVIDEALTTSGGRGFAIPATYAGGDRVKIYPAARGASSSVRVIGGRTAAVLGLPTPVFPAVAAPYGTWSIDLSPDRPEYTRFSVTGASRDLQDVHPGDLALVYGSEFADRWHGTHQIQRVHVSYPGGILTSWFEVDRIQGVSQVGVVQTAPVSLSFLRPTLLTVHDQEHTALMAQSRRALRLILPTTSEVVSRGAGRAAYPPGRTPVRIVAALRNRLGVVNILTAGPHGLVAGDRAIVQDLTFSPSYPVVSPGTDSGTLGAGHI